MIDEKFSHSGLTSEILNCFFKSYNKLGYGFTKSIYKEALHTTLNQSKLKIQKDKRIDVKLEMDVIGHVDLDLVIEEKVFVLVTATDLLEDKEVKRMFNFLRQSPYNVGLILNYGETPGYKRRDITT